MKIDKIRLKFYYFLLLKTYYDKISILGQVRMNQNQFKKYNLNSFSKHFKFAKINFKLNYGIKLKHILIHWTPPTLNDIIY